MLEFAFDYSVVRVVPRVERGEFLNAGVVVFCPTQSFLKAKIELDTARIKAVFPWIDCAEIENHARIISQVCEGTAGSIGQLSQRERFHWLVAPRSTIIQMAPVHSGLSCNLNATLEIIFDKIVRMPPQD